MRKAFLRLHIAVFLAGFTAILGKLITLNEALLVVYRLALSVGCLWLMRMFAGRKSEVSRPQALKAAAVGSVLAAHWVCFYASIKYANVSVALVCFSSISLFTSVLDPLFTRRRIDLVELFLGLLVIPAIALIFRFDQHFNAGIVFGLVSAVLAATFPVLNSILLRDTPPLAVSRWQLTGGLVFLLPVLPFYLRAFPPAYWWPTPGDWLWLLVLSLLCTVYAFTLGLQALQKIPAFTVNLTYNLEPVYGIALAFLLFHENKYFSPAGFLGLALILAAIAGQMVRKASSS